MLEAHRGDGPGPPHVGPIRMVVRRRGTWQTAEVPGSDPESVDLDTVLHHLGPDRTCAPAPSDRICDPDMWWAPAWAFVAEVRPGRLRVEDRQGRSLDLDEADLTLLDHLTTPASGAVLAMATGLDAAEVGARLERMASAAIVSRTDRPADSDASAAPASVTTSPPANPTRSHRWRTLLPSRRAPRSTTPARAVSAPVARAAAPQTGADAPVPAAARRSDDDRIPVYAIWHEDNGPLLALGMLTAAARHHEGGVLGDRYEIRRPEAATSFLEDIATRVGPAILLCSDYVWSLDQNLATARAARAWCPDLLVLHGGPSAPKYEADAEAFLRTHADVAHLLVRGEGEDVLVAVLEALRDRTLTTDLEAEALARIPGLTWIDPRSDEVVRTDDPVRIAELDRLPSPYLTGEFDHVPPLAWRKRIAVETNRGCPYGCTFCDWGSSTLSRIRKFDHERVAAEIRWAGDQGIETLMVVDANFGIMARDVETAEVVAATKQRTGYPMVLAMYPAKNTTKHLTKIMDVLLDSGVGMSGALSLQSTDTGTLAAINRSNISVEQYITLAAQFRRRGHPMFGDLMVGLPGQTFESFRADMQFLFDLEIQERTWPTHVLPNAPMNDPAYLETWRIRTDDRNIVISTATLPPEDRLRLLRLRKVGVIAERLGVFRHVLRVLQWDHDLEATHVLAALAETTRAAPTRYPLLTWLVEHFDLHPAAPVGWRAVYREFLRFTEDEFGVAPTAGARCAVEVQVALMPSPGRSFPHTVALAHDYVAYYRDATASLYTTGYPSGPTRPLDQYPPGTLTIEGDPFGLCERGPDFNCDGRDVVMESDFYLGCDSSNELLSPLIRMLVDIANHGIRSPFIPSDAPDVPLVDDVDDDAFVAAATASEPVHVSIVRRP